MTGARAWRAVIVACTLLATFACGPGGERTLPAPPTLPDAEARALLEDLLEPERSDSALARIEASGDRRFAAPLVELLWAADAGAARREGHNARVLALERLTGERYGASWSGWLGWLASERQAPPPGYARFKARLLSAVDPRYGALLEGPLDPALLVEIHWSGAEASGIPALVDPPSVRADEAGWLEAREPVIGLVLLGEARAYPLRILDWHEAANDVVGGVSVCVVSCALCGSASAWRAQGRGGERRLFEASGLLLRSTSLLLERGTSHLWSPLAPAPLGAPGEAAEAVPVVVTAWSAWRETHPGTRVLSLATGFERPYLPGQPYAEYLASPELAFPAGPGSDEVPEKERIFGLAAGGAAAAWSARELARERVVNGTVGDEPVVLVASRGLLRARHGQAGEPPLEYDVGTEVRAYRRGDHRFAWAHARDRVADEAGRSWRVGEEALVGPDGEEAPRLAGTPAFWFAWRAFFPAAGLHSRVPATVEAP